MNAILIVGLIGVGMAAVTAMHLRLTRSADDVDAEFFRIIERAGLFMPSSREPQRSVELTRFGRKRRGPCQT